LNTKSASRWFYYTDIPWCTVNKTLNRWFFNPSNKDNAVNTTIHNYTVLSLLFNLQNTMGCPILRWLKMLVYLLFKHLMQLLAWGVLLNIKYDNLKVPHFSITDLKIFKLSYMNMHTDNYSHSNVPKLPTRLLLCTHKMAMAHC
jgi:hypothetical protein